MKVVLIQTRVSEANTFLTPIGILYIASYLRERGHETIVFDVDPELNDPLPRLKEIAPDIIGFTLMTTYYKKTDATIRLLKQKMPDVIICAGGIHPSALPKRTVVELGGGIDFVVCGEGELVMAEVCDALESGKTIKNIPGTIHLVGGKVIDNGRAEPISDLDIIPFPARNLLDMENYMTPPGPIKGLPLVRTTNLISSRGCNAACTFCGNQVLFDRGVRRRSVDNVISEIEHLVDDYGLNGFNFTDDVFLSDQEWAKEFCNKLIDKNLNRLRWVGTSRANMITDEIALLMYKAGCRQLEIGVESGSPKILKAMKKGITKKIIKRGYDIAKQNGLRRMASFIIGFPGETLDDIRQTEAFAKELNPDFVSFFFLTPFPGSEIYDEAINNGWIPEDHDFMDDNWSIRQAEEPYMEIEFKKSELVVIRAELQNKFFLSNFMTNLSFSFILTLLWSLLLNPKEILRMLRLVIRTRRLDYIAEGALRAYRYKIEAKGNKMASMDNSKQNH